MSTQDFLTPPNNAEADAADDLLDSDMADDDMDDMIDGDRQLTTDSDAIDGGLNDSDLGSPRDADLDADNGTGLAETR
ncbi:MAG: hypothetical protein JO250_01750 [Armatimonadetes bacterium]|nr:hypothetical protein [Armatimonadota bacterium]